jgi:hypothetical protein
MAVKIKTVVKTQKIHALTWLLAGVFGCLLGGCDPISPADKQFFEERDQERAQREAQLRAVNDSVTSDDVIKRVRSSPARDGNGTSEEWLNRQLQEMKGQILFPRWTATRRGSNKQEVSFEFVFNDSQNQMRRLSYTWDVDVLDMTVGIPRFAQLEEIASAQQNLALQHERRLREHEQQLE